MITDAGFVGLGSMGLPMATNVIFAGIKLRVHNRTASKAEPLVAKGATLAPSAGDAAVGGGNSRLDEHDRARYCAPDGRVSRRSRQHLRRVAGLRTA